MSFGVRLSARLLAALIAILGLMASFSISFRSEHCRKMIASFASIALSECSGIEGLLSASAYRALFNGPTMCLPVQWDFAPVIAALAADTGPTRPPRVNRCGRAHSSRDASEQRTL